MAALTGRSIQSSYKDVLQVSNSNAGVDATLRSVEDGEGTSSPLQLSTAKVRVTGVNTNAAAFEVYNTVGADVNFSVNPYGEVYAAGDASLLGDLYVSGSTFLDGFAAGDVGLTVKAAASHTANLLNIVNSSDVPYIEVQNDGTVAFYAGDGPAPPYKAIHRIYANQSYDPDSRPFNFTAISSDNDGDHGYNFVVKWGHNIGDGGGMMPGATYGTIHDANEQHYWNPSFNHYWAERHIEVQRHPSSARSGVRLWTAYYDNDDDYMAISHSARWHSFGADNTDVYSGGFRLDFQLAEAEFTNTDLIINSTARLNRTGDFSLAGVLGVTTPTARLDIRQDTNKPGLQIVRHAGKSFAISTLQRASNVVTVTTSASHSIAIGDSVVIPGGNGTYAGTFTVATVPTATTFTYAQTDSNLGPTAGTGNATVADSASNSIQVVTASNDLFLVGNNGDVTIGAGSGTSSAGAKLDVLAQTGNTYAATFRNTAGDGVINFPVGSNPGLLVTGTSGTLYYRLAGGSQQAVQIGVSNAATMNMSIGTCAVTGGAGTQLVSNETSIHFTNNSETPYFGWSTTGAFATASAAGIVGLKVKGFTSQTADLQQWQNSSGTNLASISASGVLNLTTASSESISLSTANYDLLISSSVASSSFRLLPYGSDIYFDNTVAGDLIFRSNSVEKMKISSAGNVFIGGFSAGTVGVAVKAAATQTANIQEWQNNSSTVLASINSSGDLSCEKLATFKSNIKVEVGTTYTLLATDTGKVIEFTNGSAITVTLPNSFAVGFTVAIVQAGGGQITLSPASGATMVNARSHTKTYGQDACANIYVTTNSGGSSAAYRLSGDTAS